MYKVTYVRNIFNNYRPAVYGLYTCMPTCTAVGKFTIILYVLHPKYAIQIDVDTIRVLHFIVLICCVFNIHTQSIFVNQPEVSNDPETYGS